LTSIFPNGFSKNWELHNPKPHALIPNRVEEL
jgi:hypothetical protein